MPMQRVLILVPEAPALVESAALAMSTAGPRIARSALKLHPAIHLDERFAATPVEVQAEGAFAMGLSARASTGGKYVVRGTVDTKDLAAAREAAQASGHEIYSDPDIGLVTCGGDPPLGTTLDVRQLLAIGPLQAIGGDGSNVALAIVDTGINLDRLRALGLSPTLDPHMSWSPLVTVQPGAAPVDHGTMCAFDASLAAPGATLLDYAVLQSTRHGGSILDGVLSDAVQAYGVLLKLMLLPDDKRPFHSLVVSNSWGMFNPSWDFPPGVPGRYADNPAHPFNRIVGSLVAAGADVLFAAGNCGPECPDSRCQGNTSNTITGANSHPDVITVAGVDTADNRVGYSSVGPGALTHDKPDLAAYTHFLGSEVFGVGQPDSGTSAACPVLAGIVAALRSLVPFDRSKPNRTPAQVKQFLLQNARRPDGAAAGWTNDVGFGIPDNLAQVQAALP
jgi:Subtilase family